MAGTRVLAALEAVRKASATHDEELTVVERAEASVLFRVRTSDREAFVLTLPIRLFAWAQSVVAMVVKKSQRPQSLGGWEGRGEGVAGVAAAGAVAAGGSGSSGSGSGRSGSGRSRALLSVCANRADERLGCDVLEYELSVTWKDCMTPGRKAMAACYASSGFTRPVKQCLPRRMRGVGSRS